MSGITLVTGGGRSGKSDFAIASARMFRRCVFIATAEACDAEMAARIAAHRASRGPEFVTVEEPLDLAGALARLPTDAEVAVVDCLTVWLGNWMHRDGNGAQTQAAVDALVEAIPRVSCTLILVTNEVGMGIIPDNAMAREFRDLAGRLNARLARVAQRVVLMVAGLPLYLKGEA